ncbi:MAG: hypothetical protein JO303_18670 [Caulobacteraceae bacterium]|nr:hypothetical protein [Caulobacteraceae bacterium]
MDEDAFAMLAQIDQGADVRAQLRTRWLQALKAIRWIVETDKGLHLTTAGREALRDFKVGRR